MEAPANTAHRLGAQVWLEPDDSAERVDYLFRMLAESGMGWARLFLMWPWIEAEPDAWDFSLFDAAYEAAGRHGIRIKATLTANSGPWHIGTPSVLHSFTGVLHEGQRPAMERYIRKCVRRYAGHPAHGQWILWNEPYGKPQRTEVERHAWQAWLKKHYNGTIGPLNRRWRTGYEAFEDIPFPEAVSHPMHREDNWNSYGPWLLDWQFRSNRILEELQWIREIVLGEDPDAEMVINPNQVIANHAESGTDLAGMARLADVLGASFHPAWHFTFAGRAEFPALIAAGVHLLKQEGARVEITEVQFGNTVNSSRRPSAVLPAELKHFILAGLAAGAEQVIGWCLNVRSRDFEAGDWGLLDNMDEASPRSEAVRELSIRMADLESRFGPLDSVDPEAHVVVDPRSQAIEWVESLMGQAVPGREFTDAAQGAGKIASLLSSMGIATAISSPGQLPESVRPGTLVVVSHLVAMETAFADRLIRLAESGAVVIIDATSGRKDPDAALHRPWPAGFAGMGLTAADLESNPDGHALVDDGQVIGRTVLTRLIPRIANDAWQPYGSLVFASDGSPLMWERPTGKGKLILFRGLLGPSLLYDDGLGPALRRHLHPLLGNLAQRPRPANPSADMISIPCRLGNREATLVLRNPTNLPAGQDAEMEISAAAPSLEDLWNAQTLAPASENHFKISTPEGIALLLNPQPSSLVPRP